MLKLILFFLLLINFLVFSQQAVPSENNESGFITEYSFSEFKQIIPEIEKPSTEKTNVGVRYDNNNLYVSFKLLYKNPENIFASVLERDQPLDADDYVEVVIDSYNDKNNALGFQTNFLGTRRDFEVTKNGQNINASWNTFWDVTTEETANGWNAEFVIPFSSLRYEATKKNIMGFKFIRYIRSNNEIDTFPLKNSELDNTLFHLYNVEEIEFRNLGKKNPLFITPYITGTLISNSVLNTAGNSYQTEDRIFEGKNYFAQSALDKILSNIGFDLKYRISNSTTLDFTLNTDFAQAESDDRVINLTRYSISLPEKRPFFLENSSFFASSFFQHTLFQSRVVGISGGENVPIIGGIRLSGTINNFQYGFMNIQTKGIEGKNLEAENFSVVRLLKYYGGGNSFIGGSITNKFSVETSGYNRVIGLDGGYYFNDNVYALFFGSKSFSSNSTGNRTNSYGISLNKSQNSAFNFGIWYRVYEKNFDPQMGFLPRPDTKKITLDGSYVYNFTENNLFSSMNYGLYHTTFWIASTNQPEYSRYNPYWHANFKNGASISAYGPVIERDHLYSEWKFSDNITIPIGKYNYTTYEVYYKSGKGSNFSYELDPIIGSFYGGFQFIFLSSLNIIISKNLNIDFELSYNNFKFPESYTNNNDQYEVITLYSTRLNYSFSSKVSLKAFLQYDNQSKNIGSNIRFRYNPIEGTDLYIVYNQNINTERGRLTPPKPLIESQAFVIKFSKTFLF